MDMVCVYCGGKTKVANSRRTKNNHTWRRRVCLDCGYVFTTRENAQLNQAISVSHHSKIEPFLADKLYTEILLALQDRPHCYEEARELTTTITRKLIESRSNPLESTDISQIASQALKRFNRRCWLRYATEHPSIKV